MTKLSSHMKYISNVFNNSNKRNQNALEHIYQNHLPKVIHDINKYSLFSNEIIDIGTLLNKDEFKYGILSRYLSNNNYRLNVLDVAISLHIACRYKSNSFYKLDDIVKSAICITIDLKESLEEDYYIKKHLSSIGKNVSDIHTSMDSIKIEEFLKKNKNVYERYFGLFQDEEYKEKITIFYPSDGHSHLDYNSKMQLKINFNNIEKGFFLMGIEYKYSDNEWLESATRTANYEYFNRNSTYGELIWSK